MPVILALLATTADAAEVVWLAPANPDVAAVTATRAGATRGPLEPIDLRAAATDWSQADVDAYAKLSASLAAVRAYETKLDGELLIMDELQAPIAAIGIIRDGDDRGKVFSALAYQGFAVDRFFEDTLGTDDRAANYRVVLDGKQIARPWADAVALDPQRAVTPYDIAEAPQRVHYGEASQSVNKALPARLVPAGLPAGGKLFVDGRESDATASSIAVPPGRHLAHFAMNGHILARWDVQVESAGKADLTLPLSDAGFEGFITAASGSAPPDVPEPVRASVQALGGEVWLVTSSVDNRGRTTIQGWSVTPSGATPIDLDLDMDAGVESDSGLSFAVGLGAGWLGSQELYYQDPLNVPATGGTVNSAQISLAAGLDYDLGSVLRFGAGLEMPITLGADHAAIYGDKRTALRPLPYVSAGVRPIQAAVGFMFPRHPAMGLRGQLPFWGPIELQGSLWAGIPVDREREGAEAWDAKAVGTGQLGLGARF